MCYHHFIMNKLLKCLNKLQRKGFSDNNEGVLLIKRFIYYFEELNEGKVDSLYDINAFYNVLLQLDIIMDNILDGKPLFYNITGLIEKAYLSNTGASIDSFILYLPSKFTNKRNYPLIVFLHGYGERAYLPINSKAHNELLKVCDRKGIIMVAPCGKHVPGCDVPSYKNGEEDVLHVIDIVKTSYPISSAEIYLTGVSMGGHGTWYIASRHPKQFAAIAPVCGYGKGEYGSPAIDLNGLIELPVYAFHGDSDTVVSVESTRVMVNALKNLRCNVQYREFAGVGHDCWDYAYSGDFIVDWLLSHRIIDR